VRIILTTAVFAMLIAGCQSQSHSMKPDASTTSNTLNAPSIPQRAEDAEALKAGDRAPGGEVRTAEGRSVDLSDLYHDKPSVLIFYRGGWCPYCTDHMKEVAAAEPKLVDMGYQVLAISPDSPDALKQSLDQQAFTYQLLSDSDMSVTRAFGLAFQVDDPTIQKYQGFGIDLEKASGYDHHLLPVPAVYIVDTAGTIRFAHWDPDYKQRLSSDKLLEAAGRVTAR